MKLELGLSAGDINSRRLYNGQAADVFVDYVTSQSHVRVLCTAAWSARFSTESAFSSLKYASSRLDVAVARRLSSLS